MVCWWLHVLCIGNFGHVCVRYCDGSVADSESELIYGISSHYDIFVFDFSPTDSCHITKKLSVCRMSKIQGQFIKKPNFFFNLLLYLQCNQTCLLQSTPLHSWYTMPNVFSSSGTCPGTCFAGWRGCPLSNFLLSPLPSEISDHLVRILTSGIRKSLQGPNLESRAAGEQQCSHASSKIHG